MRPARSVSTSPKRQFIHLTAVCAALAASFSSLAAADPPRREPPPSATRITSDVETGWNNPPTEARTRAFWWWLNGNVTAEAITRDLEEMKVKGMGGALIFDADGSAQRGNRQVPAGPLYGSDAWRELFVHAVQEADRLGLELSLSIQSGWNLGGPDVTPQEAAKQVTWSEVKVDSPGPLRQSLPQPPTRLDFYRDIAVLALREKTSLTEELGSAFTISASGSQASMPASKAVDGDPSTFWVSQGIEPGQGPGDGKSEWLGAAFGRPTVVSGLYVAGRSNYGPKRCQLFASRDNRSFSSVTDELAVENGRPLQVRFDPISARHFRLVMTEAFDVRYPESPRNVQVVEFTLLDGEGRSLNPQKGAGSIRDLNAKSMSRELGGSAPDCRPLLFDVPATPGEVDVAIANVVDLSDRLADDGTLDWLVPEGDWTVLRFGYTPTGARVSTSSGDWQGLVVDYMSERVIQAYWNRHTRPLLELVRPHCGTALKYVETDSWECGGMNWTPDFEREFLAYLGYDPVPWLPVLAGRIVEDRESSNAFLADFRKAIAHCVAENHYRVLGELAHEFDLGIQPESGGPHAGPLDGLKNLGRSDLAMSEFWRPSPHRPHPENRFFVKQAASAAHTYGIELIGAEGFTSIGPHWEDSFWRYLKPSFDHEACDGLNLTFVHTFTCSPASMGLPGQEYFAGTHFNPNCTWWPMAGAFVDYLNRCHWMLQQGRFVADVAYYYGDHVPNIARRKDDDPAGVLPGYDYDVLSEEVLGRLTVRDGVLHLPTGMQYRVLVLPDHRVLSLAALHEVNDLVSAGATVVGPKPERAVSLLGGADAVAEFKRLSAETWDMERTDYAIAEIGPQEILRELGVDADFSHHGGQDIQLAWIHRAAADFELYFVASQVEAPVAVDCSFRISGRQPELWDPMDGSRRDATAFAQRDGRTIIPLKFDPYGSVFVLFRRSIPDGRQGWTESNDLTCGELFTLEGPWTVRFDSKWGGPESIVFETLSDWSQHDQPGIRYYSGIAAYENRFTVAENLAAVDSGRVYVDLGTVHEMAEVRLNDRLLGVAWAPPFRVDVTDAVKPGVNRLEIRVANQWPNRRIGDQHLPPEKRLTRTNITKFTTESPLLPSGLLGPVRLLTAERSFRVEPKGEGRSRID